VERCGPSHRRAQNASAALRIFVHRPKKTIATWGNSRIEPDTARESAFQERMRPASCGLATMESGNGKLCRAGRVVEADIDLRDGPDGVSRARGCGRFRSWANSVYVSQRRRMQDASASRPDRRPRGCGPSLIGLSVICIDARHAKAVLKMQINKNDRNMLWDRSHHVPPRFSQGPESRSGQPAYRSVARSELFKLSQSLRTAARALHRP
jgi:hypothetical protein